MWLGRRTFVGALVGGMMMVLPRALAQPAGDGSFRDEVAEVLRRRRPALRFTLPADPETIVIGSVQIYTGNLQRDVEGLDGAAREQAILDFIDRVTRNWKSGETSTGSWRRDKERLRIQIAPAEYRDLSAELLSRDFTPQNIIVYALDETLSYMLVTRDMAASWGVDPGLVHAAAVAGLDRLSERTPIAVSRPAGGPGAYAVLAAGDGYDAARLLAPRFMQRLRKALTDTVIVGIPGRDRLVAWTPDCGARARLAADVESDSESLSHPLTGSLFVAGPGGVRLATAAETAAQHG